MKKFIVCSLITYLFAQIDYETEIQPIFNNNCINCHGNSGGLSLESYDNLMAGGNSGTIVISGNHSNSLLWQKLNTGEMPPNGELSSSDIDLIAGWIDEGALEELNTYSNNQIPKQLILNQNYPNPFNPSTEILYNIPNDDYISIIIFNVKGNRIMSLVNDYQSTGKYSIHWNGKNKQGESVPAGMYIYSLQAGSYGKTKKMVLLK